MIKLLRKQKPVTIILSCCTIVIALLLPLLFNNYYLRLLTQIVLYAYLASSWNILGGFAGQFSLGHAMYIGIGVYTTFILYNQWGISPWISMIVGGVLAVIAGTIIGVPCFRLNNVFYTLATLAICKVMLLIVKNTINIGSIRVGGAGGLHIRARQGNSLLYLQFSNYRYYYYICLAFLFLMIILCSYIKHSKFGYQLAAIANDQTAAETLGVNSTRIKLKAMIVSVFTSAVGGTLYAQLVLSATPEKVFGEALSDEMVIIALIGGSGTVIGPTIGAIIIKTLSQITTTLVGGTVPGLNLAIYGVFLMLCIIFFPDGIYSIIKNLIKKRKRKSSKVQEDVS